MAQYLTPALLQVTDSSSNPLVGAKLSIYEVGTTTLLDLFSDEALSTPAANPLIADAAGVFPGVFLAETVFKAVLQSSTDVTLYTREEVYSIGASDSIAASGVSFDGTDIGYSADNVQDAIVELAQSAGSPTTTRGDLIFRGASVDERLAKGTEKQILSQGADDPAWAWLTDCIAGIIPTPATGDNRLVVNIPFGGTITSTTTRSTTGTATATFKINTTALGGTANAVSSSEVAQAHASSNVFAAGDDIVVTWSSVSSAANVSITIAYTRGIS